MRPGSCDRQIIRAGTAWTVRRDDRLSKRYATPGGRNPYEAAHRLPERGSLTLATVFSE